MSYTNQTKNYGLPQYVGTDVPAWLTDVNGAFATIDQGMNAAKTQADSAATAAGQAANDITSINSTLGTQAGQISAAAGAAAAAQTTANTADGKADANAQSISGLDTRVTALEQGGGAAVAYVDVVKPSGTLALNLNEAIPAGKKAISGTVSTIVNAPSNLVTTFVTIDAYNNHICALSVTNTGVISALTTYETTMRIYYV